MRTKTKWSLLMLFFMLLSGLSSCEDNQTSKSGSGKKSNSFLTVGTKSTYVATFMEGYPTKKATFTLYKDGSGTCETDIKFNLELEATKQCEWEMTEVSKPMSMGGDGEPHEAINIRTIYGEYTITKDHKIYDGGVAVGSVNKK